MKARKKIYMVMAVEWDHEYLAASKGTRYKKGQTLAQQMETPAYKKFTKWLDAHLKREDGSHRSYIVRRRVWGWTSRREDAFHWVRRNGGDDFDEAGYYNGAVVEEVQEGGCSWTHNRWFFRHGKPGKDGRCVRLVKMREPDCLRQIVGLTLG